MQTELFLQNSQNSLYVDIQQHYNRYIGYSNEDLVSNKALLKIIATVFSGKPVIKVFSRNEDLLSFNKENLKYVDECLQKNDCNEDSILTILTNCIAIVHKEIITRPRKPNEKELSKFRKNHFDISAVVDSIRGYYGFRNKTLKQIEIEFIIQEILLVLLSIFLLLSSVTFFVLAGWWNQNPPIIQQNGGNWFSSTFVNPLSNWLFQSGLLPAGQNVVSFVPFIIVTGIILIMLFIGSVWFNKKIMDRNKLQFQIHFLCRNIGMNCVELQNTGWL